MIKEYFAWIKAKEVFERYFDHWYSWVVNAVASCFLKPVIIDKCEVEYKEKQSYVCEMCWAENTHCNAVEDIIRYETTLKIKAHSKEHWSIKVEAIRLQLWKKDPVYTFKVL
jgi:hypothetical protein